MLQFNYKKINNILPEVINWLQANRINCSANNCAWNFLIKIKNPEYQKNFINSLVNGTYQFSPMQQYRLPNEILNAYCGADTVVLKIMQIILKNYCISNNLIGKTCYHFENNGGLKGAVNAVASIKNNYKFALKSDVFEFYDSINHDILYARLINFTKNIIFTKLIISSIQVCKTYGGLYWDKTQGINRGSAIAPLLGAIMLADLGKAMNKYSNIFYACYMDDFIILCKTRYKLRKIIKTTHKILSNLGFKMHPNKTFIGSLKRDFNFLGYKFSHKKNLSLAKKTIINFSGKLQVLFEQHTDINRIFGYCRRFYGWVHGKLQSKFQDKRIYLIITKHYVNYIFLKYFNLFGTFWIKLL